MTLLDQWVAFSKAHTDLQQFGQGGDVSTFGGATGCTHTCLQRLIAGKTGHVVTHDEISHVAGYPWPGNNPTRRGLRTPSEVQRVVSHYGLPYKVVFNWPWWHVIKATGNGPVMYGVLYGWWPEWHGYVYNGTHADGLPGGYAIRNGKTQLYGFTGRHAVLLLAERTVNGQKRTIANEPNHGAPARPEKPDYDIVRSDFAQRAYDKYAASGYTTFAWIPTTTFAPKGF